MNTAFRTLRILPLVALLAGTAACGDDLTGVADSDIRGTWELDEQETVFLYIEDDRIVVYDDDLALNCFERTIIDIVDRESDDWYTLRVRGQSQTSEAQIRRSGTDRLRFETGSVVAFYGRTSVRVGDLAVC